METVLYGLIIVGVLLMAAGIFLGRRRTTTVVREGPADDGFTVASEDPVLDASARAGEAAAVSNGGETIEEAQPRR
jgi:hypothetical protein